MKGSIKVSEKHGVNPMLLQCDLCGRDAGLALLGRLPGDAEAPRQGRVKGHFCTECQSAWDQGAYFFIEVKDGETGENPFRTGRFWAITAEAFHRMYHGIEGRVCYIEQSTAQKMGFPDLV